LIDGALAQATTKPVTVKSGAYSGTTSEKQAVTFTISGHTLSNFKTEIGYNGHCGQGGGPGYTITVKRVRIHANGAFLAKITLVGPVAAVKSAPGTLQGKASGGKVTGKIVDTSSYFTPGTCNGYTETFTATLH
jgi:hypothetical protein